MAEPLISILMPTCNRPVWLGQAIRSALAQTYPHWEMIVIQDGGEDSGETQAVVEAFQDVRITWRRIAHVGCPGAVRNAGLSLAKGEFVFRLDDDDELNPACLETLSRYFIDEPGLNAVITTCLFMDEASRITRYPANLVQDEAGGFCFNNFPGEITWSAVFEHIASGLLPCPTMLVRRPVLVEIGGYDPTLRYWEDAKLVVELLRQGLHRVRFLPLPLYHYRRHSQNITRNTPETVRRWVEDKWAFFQWLYGLPELPPERAAGKQLALTQIYQDHIPPLLARGELALAQELLLMARTHPDFDQQAWQNHLAPMYRQTFPPTPGP